MARSREIRMASQEVGKAILGKQECIDLIMTAILAQGHVLVEDIPGVGKTTLALAFAKVLGLKQKRVQFTPDVLPSDIVGFSMYHKDLGKFAYHPGAVMCNLFLADEINRTSTKTQSALLEVMEEGTVTVDSVTHQVPQPFLVIATENPIGSAGTQQLPESQLDRFMVSLEMGYPEKEDEINILINQAENKPMEQVRQVMRKEDLIMAQEEVKKIFVHSIIYNYIVELARMTRNHEMLMLGISPRGSLAIAAMARANAYMNGRNFVVPDDVTEIFESVVRHRIRLNAQAKMRHITVEDVIKDILGAVKKPRPEKKYEK